MRPFPCPHCEKVFRTTGHRKTHIASHFKSLQLKRSKFPRKTRKAKVSKSILPVPDIPLQEPILISDYGMSSGGIRSLKVLIQCNGLCCFCVWDSQYIQWFLELEWMNWPKFNCQCFLYKYKMDYVRCSYVLLNRPHPIPEPPPVLSALPGCGGQWKAIQVSILQ